MNEFLDFMDVGSGLPSEPICTFPNMGQMSADLIGYEPLPTDIHTDVDVSFYDDKIDDARESLIDASKGIVNAQTMDDINRAIEQGKQAQADIDYWEDCRTKSECNQTIDNIRTDAIINSCNKAFNDLHNTLNSIPQNGHGDYTNDIFMQGMDWDKLAQQIFEYV